MLDMRLKALEVLLTYLREGRLMNCVNLNQLSRA